MSDADTKIEHLKRLANFASELCDYIHEGDHFPKGMSGMMPVVKAALVLADCIPSSGAFTSELADIADMERTRITGDDIRLVQGMLGLELTEKQYEDILEHFPKNARKKFSSAVEFIGRSLQIFISDELAHS